MYAPESTTFTLDPSVLPFTGVHRLLSQLPTGDGMSHIVALLAIVALVALGTVLVIRDRFTIQSQPGQQEQTEPEDTLTDQERVCSLIENNGGRMKQSAIVDSVEWSKAKVSRLLADLEEEGEITKLRLGRENLICMRGHEPPVSQSSDPPREI